MRHLELKANIRWLFNQKEAVDLCVSAVMKQGVCRRHLNKLLQDDDHVHFAGSESRRYGSSRRIVMWGTLQF